MNHEEEKHYLKAKKSISTRTKVAFSKKKSEYNKKIVKKKSK
jgi:hypothetical protein